MKSLTIVETVTLMMITAIFYAFMLWNSTCFELGWCHIKDCDGLFGPTQCYDFRFGGWQIDETSSLV